MKEKIYFKKTGLEISENGLDILIKFFIVISKSTTSFPNVNDRFIHNLITEFLILYKPIISLFFLF